MIFPEYHTSVILWQTSAYQHQSRECLIFLNGNTDQCLIPHKSKDFICWFSRYAFLSSHTAFERCRKWLLTKHSQVLSLSYKNAALCEDQTHHSDMFAYEIIWWGTLNIHSNGLSNEAKIHYNCWLLICLLFAYLHGEPILQWWWWWWC